MNTYKVYDNKGNAHELAAKDDKNALEIMKTKFINYIVSVLSSDAIVLVRPNGYILAYINTATGEQTIKSMKDWNA